MSGKIVFLLKKFNLFTLLGGYFVLNENVVFRVIFKRFPVKLEFLKMKTWF